MAGTASAQLGIFSPPRLRAPEPLEIKSTPIATFSHVDPARRRFGRLEFRGGLVLTSAHASFGGLSDLAVSNDGRRVIAVSDEGAWLSAEIDYDGLSPSGLSHARIGPLTDTKGASLLRKRNCDAEAMSLLEGSLSRGTLLIGFERNHRIGRFPVIDGVVQAPTTYLKLPPEARRMNSNKGFEALAVVQSGALRGSIVAISERFHDAAGHHTGWIWIKGEARRFAITDVGGFDITSAAALADGALIVLERRFRWSEGIKMRLRYLPRGVLAPGAVIEGEPLLEADMRFEIDNMEGVAAHKDARGETVLTLISDDNFNHLLQRTVLLQFTLQPKGVANAG